MRVCRVGSMMHQGLLEAKRRKNLPKINGKTQKLGGVYKDKAGKMYVYMGRIRNKQDNKLQWAYVDLREPYRSKKNAANEKWHQMTIQEKFDHEREYRKSSGCAESRTTAMALIEHLGDIDMGKETAETLMWFPTKIVDGQVLRL